ncbi:hypothetical protein BKA56DRAFT_138913 [Ilyonectria sp. MPI-CAGE-AT-0026]|nr:hypothetical protein BKA56DRAFT_138913 [Ilyonectria sp. MPI-CAGE-AT-0026]
MSQRRNTPLPHPPYRPTGCKAGTRSALSTRQCRPWNIVHPARNTMPVGILHPQANLPLSAPSLPS